MVAVLAVRAVKRSFTPGPGRRQRRLRVRRPATKTATNGARAVSAPVTQYTSMRQDGRDRAVSRTVRSSEEVRSGPDRTGRFLLAACETPGHSHAVDPMRHTANACMPIWGIDGGTDVHGGWKGEVTYRQRCRRGRALRCSRWHRNHHRHQQVQPRSRRRRRSVWRRGPPHRLRGEEDQRTWVLGVGVGLLTPPCNRRTPHPSLFRGNHDGSERGWL